jgi:hypothetical protein
MHTEGCNVVAYLKIYAAANPRSGASTGLVSRADAWGVTRFVHVGAGVPTVHGAMLRLLFGQLKFPTTGPI